MEELDVIVVWGFCTEDLEAIAAESGVARHGGMGGGEGGVQPLALHLGLSLSRFLRPLRLTHDLISGPQTWGG